jgi:hypothetical protein
MTKNKNEEDFDHEIHDQKAESGKAGKRKLKGSDKINLNHGIHETHESGGRSATPPHFQTGS